MPRDTSTNEDGNGEEDNDGQNQEDGIDGEVDDLQYAWEALDYARRIYDAHPGEDSDLKAPMPKQCYLQVGVGNCEKKMLLEPTYFLEERGQTLIYFMNFFERLHLRGDLLEDLPGS